MPAHVLFLCGTDRHLVNNDKLCALSSPFGSFFERPENWHITRIDMSVDPPELIRCLAEFVNTSKYDTPPPRERRWEAYKDIHDLLDTLDHHAQMRALAKEKGMPALEQYSMKKFRGAVRGCKGWQLRRAVRTILAKKPELTGSLDQERLRSILKTPACHRLPEIQFLLHRLRSLVAVPSEY